MFGCRNASRPIIGQLGCWQLSAAYTVPLKRATKVPSMTIGTIGTIGEVLRKS
jgi:hypothetical protein